MRYFRDLRQMIADGQPLTPESTGRAMSRYATETATDYAPNARGDPPRPEQPAATFGALDAFIRKNPGRPAA